MKTRNLREVVRDIASRRDPQGYYVLTARPEARKLLENLGVEVVEEAGGLIVARTRSRRKIVEAVKTLYKKNLLVLNP